MNFELAPEQTLLKDSVERYLHEAYDAAERRRQLVSGSGWSRRAWADFAELGLLGVAVAETDGGFGGGPVDTMNVMQAMGSALSLEPYLTSAVLCTQAIAFLGTGEQKQKWLPSLLAGNLVMAYAHSERAARYEIHHVSTTARRTTSGYVLDGDKTLVSHGGTADALLVSARLEGSVGDEAGVGLFLIESDAPGVARRIYRTQDAVGSADIQLRGAEVAAERLLGLTGDASATVRKIAEHGIAAVAAEAVGIMEDMLRLTLEHLRTRRQFGVPIGSFQVLQHRAVDMAVAVEQARSMAIYGALMLDEADARARAQALAAVKVQCNKSLRFVAQQSVQLHGAIGLTSESRVGDCFLRATVLETQFGDTDHHLRQLAQAF